MRANTCYVNWEIKSIHNSEISTYRNTTVKNQWEINQLLTLNRLKFFVLKMMSLMFLALSQLKSACIRASNRILCYRFLEIMERGSDFFMLHFDKKEMKRKLRIFGPINCFILQFLSLLGPFFSMPNINESQRKKSHYYSSQYQW